MTPASVCLAADSPRIGGKKIQELLVGKDQRFPVRVDADTFTQTGTLSNPKALSEVWKRVS